MGLVPLIPFASIM